MVLNNMYYFYYYKYILVTYFFYKNPHLPLLYSLDITFFYYRAIFNKNKANLKLSTDIRGVTIVENSM